MNRPSPNLFHHHQSQFVFASRRICHFHTYFPFHARHVGTVVRKESILFLQKNKSKNKKKEKNSNKRKDTVQRQEVDESGAYLGVGTCGKVLHGYGDTSWVVTIWEHFEVVRSTSSYNSASWFPPSFIQTLK